MSVVCYVVCGCLCVVCDCVFLSVVRVVLYGVIVLDVCDWGLCLFSFAILFVFVVSFVLVRVECVLLFVSEVCE